MEAVRHRVLSGEIIVNNLYVSVCIVVERPVPAVKPFCDLSPDTPYSPDCCTMLCHDLFCQKPL